MRQLKALDVIRISGIIGMTMGQARARQYAIAEGKITPYPEFESSKLTSEEKQAKRDEIDAETAEFITNQPITFKKGEVFGYDDIIPKSSYPVLEDVKTGKTLQELHLAGKSKSPEKEVKKETKKAS